MEVCERVPWSSLGAKVNWAEGRLSARAMVSLMHPPRQKVSSADGKRGSAFRKDSKSLPTKLSSYTLHIKSFPRDRGVQQKRLSCPAHA